MRKILFALLGLVAVVAIAVVAIPLLISPDEVKAQIAAQVKAATGRDLAIGGDVDVSVFPSLTVQVGDVALSSPPGFKAKELVRVGALDLSLKIMPLLSGQIEIDSFRLIDPVFTLESNVNGNGNWSFETAGAAPESSSKSGSDFIKDIRLGDVGVQNGKLTYTDVASGAVQEADGINLQIQLPGLDAPLAVDGDLMWRKQKIAVKLGLTNPRSVVSRSGETPVSLTFSAAPLAVSVTGSLAASTSVLTGAVDLSSPSVRELVMWTTGQPLDAPGTGFGPLSIKGRLTASANKVSFVDAAISLDAVKANGALEVETAGARPALRGRLDVESLDLNPYLPPPAPSGPIVWTDDPIDASALRSADADFTLAIGSMKIRNITVGRSAAALRLRGGRLSTDLRELAFYGGAGAGSLTIDGSQRGVGVEASFSLKNLQAEPFLTDAADFKRLTGTGATDLKISGRGGTQREIISSLSGQGRFSFVDGAIKGIDIPGMVRNVTSAFAAQGEAQKTDFAELSATYMIADGIVSNKDLILQAPVLRVAGAGTIDLPNRAVKYRIEPKLAGTLEGQGGKLDVAGLMVPVIVEGPWDKLSYKPDLASAAKGAAGNALRGVLGGKTESTRSPLPSLKGLLPGLGAPK